MVYECILVCLVGEMLENFFCGICKWKKVVKKVWCEVVEKN